MKIKKNLTKKILSMPDCNDATSNLQIVSAHQLTSAEHDSMVASFFGGANPAPKTLDMNAIDYTLNCQYYGIKISFDATDHTSNQDINVSMALISSLSSPHADYFIMYSIHFFKGLKTGKSVTTLELRKAYRNEDGTNVTTIALRGLDSSGKLVYNGDLTHMFPIK